MGVTECFRLMLQWINGHGFVTIQQATTWMQLRFEPAQHRLGLLVRAGYFRRMRFGHLGPFLHWLTKKGGEFVPERQFGYSDC